MRSVRFSSSPLRHQLFLGYSEVVSFFSYLQHGLGKLRVVAQNAAEVSFLQNKQVALRFSPDCSRARSGDQQADFAKKVAITERLNHLSHTVNHLDFAG